MNIDEALGQAIAANRPVVANPPGNPGAVAKPATADRRISPAQDRLSVVETIYYQVAGEQPTCKDARYWRETGNSGESPYIRKLEVGTDWQPLVTNYWLSKMSMLWVYNEEGRFTQRIPTEAERLESEAKVLELCYGDPATAPLRDQWYILPRESFRGSPADLKALHIRCRQGTAKYTIALYPG